jgi:hypothetical protein
MHQTSEHPTTLIKNINGLKSTARPQHSDSGRPDYLTVTNT